MVSAQSEDTKAGPKKTKILSDLQFFGQKYLIDARGQRRMATLPRANEKVTVT